MSRPWYIPSPTGLGIGMLVPANAITTMFIGALGDWIWRKLRPAQAVAYSIPLASGFIAGDALVAVILPITYVLGIWGPP